jgi:hypothetical protein
MIGRPAFLRGRSLLLLTPVAVALIVVVIRAATQSITIDEAAAYEAFVQHGARSMWIANAGNHVLFTVLAVLTTSVFGPHVFALRLPTLFGAAMYFGSAVYLCRVVVTGAVRRTIFLTAFCLNPLILDFLVAARGYGLALGFLLIAVCVLTSVLLRVDTLKFVARDFRLLAGASAALGLSVCANFSFASPVAVLGATFLVTVATVRRPAANTLAKVTLALVYPGLVVLFCICGYTLLHFPTRQLVYGASTVGVLVRSVVNDSLHSPNGNILNPELLQAAHWLTAVVPYAVVAGLVLAVANAVWRHRARGGGRLTPAQLVALLGAATVILTVAVHGVLRAAFGTLMPEGRTASWIVPMVVLTLAAATADEPAIRVGRRRPGLGIVTLVAGMLAVANVTCLRISYFQQWQFDADTHAAYQLLAHEARRLHVVQPVVDWHYNAAINFYRYQSPDPPIGIVAGDRTYPAGHRLYLLYAPTGAAFIAAHHLVTVWHGTNSKVVIAEDPASARGLKGNGFNPF